MLPVPLPKTQTPVLRLRDITVGYGADPIVRGVSLDVTAGRITTIIGPNGCGKSTLLRAAAGILPLTRGEVLINGQPRTGQRPKALARQIAMLPQGPIAPEGLSVQELVAQGRFPHQTLLRQWSAEDEAAVQRAMQMTNTTALADMPVDALSGGQRQRCWIAMVLAQDTDIVLLDEPATYLDLKFQIELMQLLRRVAWEDGRCLLVVMHELNVAAAFADEVVMMRAGQIAAQGSATEVFTPDTLNAVFHLDAQVMRDPQSGRPVCLPVIEEAAS